MTHVTEFYSLTHLIGVEITRYPGTRSKKIELVIGGEARQSGPAELLKMAKTLEEIRKKLRI